MIAKSAWWRRSIPRLVIAPLLLLAGLLAGLVPAMFSSNWYLAEADVASTASGNVEGAGVRLPTADVLRRLVYRRDNLSILGTSAGLANRQVQLTVLNPETPGPTIWRWQAEVRAADAAAALDQAAKYFEQLQIDFAIGSEPRWVARGGAYQFASEKGPVEPDTDVLDRLRRQERVLEGQARLRGVRLSEVPRRLAEEQTRFEQNRHRVERLERAIRERLAMVKTLEAKLSGPLPQSIVCRFPAMGFLEQHIADGERKDALWASCWTPEHPKRKALAGAIDRLRARLGQEADSACQQLRAEIERDDRLVELIHRQMSEQQAALEPLRKLEADRLEWEDQLRRSQAFLKPVPLATKSLVPVPAPAAAPSTGPSPTRPAIGSILVAGPWVSDQPLRPKTARNLAVGGLIGCLAGVIVLIWPSRRVRVRPQDPIDFTHLDLD